MVSLISREYIDLDNPIAISHNCIPKILLLEWNQC